MESVLPDSVAVKRPPTPPCVSTKPPCSSSSSSSKPQVPPKPASLRVSSSLAPGAAPKEQLNSGEHGKASKDSTHEDESKGERPAARQSKQDSLELDLEEGANGGHGAVVPVPDAECDEADFTLRRSKRRPRGASNSGRPSFSAQPRLRRRSTEAFGSLILRRHKYFQQLSHGAEDYVEDKSIKKLVGQRKASWQSYVGAGRVDAEHPVNDVLANIDGGLAQVEALVKTIRVSQGDHVSARSLDKLVRRQNRIKKELNAALRAAEPTDSDSDSEEDLDVAREEERPDHVLDTTTDAESDVSELAARFEQTSSTGANAAASGACGRGRVNPTSSRSFNLFVDRSPAPSVRSNASDVTVSSPQGRNVSDDYGYLSDNSATGLGNVTARVRHLIDSFGKGNRRKRKKRPQISDPMAQTTSINLAAARPERGENNNLTVDASATAPCATDSVISFRSDFSSSSETVPNRDSLTSGSSAASTADSGDVVVSHFENESEEEKQARKVFNIAKEIMSSEEDYVGILKMLCENFRGFITSKNEGNKVIPEKEFSKLFLFLPEIVIFNSDLLKDFRERISKWSEEKKIADVIVKKGAFLKLYTSYVQEFQSISQLYLELLDRHPTFRALTLEFERQPQCRSLKISHFMLKPVQRLPQYKLLLEQYLKNIAPESEDFANATEALAIVTQAAEHVNEKMKHNDNFKQLLNLQTRLGETDLVQANRELIKSGEINKISRGGIDQRFLILCSDCIIYAKYTSPNVGDQTSLKLCYKIPLSSLQVSEPNVEEYPRDFNIISPVRSCTLRADSPLDRELWVTAISKAVRDFIERRATFMTGSDAGGASSSFETSSTPEPTERTTVGDRAPVWVPDARVTMCQMCHVAFTLIVRRHHCRACGSVVCSTCSANRAPLKYMGYEAAKVCDPCFNELTNLQQKDDVLRSRRSLFQRASRPVPGGRAVPKRLQVRANDKAARMSGYLQMRKARTGKWRRMWFVLKDHVVYAFSASEDTVAKKTYPVLGFELNLDLEVPPDFSSYQGRGRMLALMHDNSEPLVFFAESEQTAERWTAAFIDAVAIPS